jgi:hypothetical protein
MLEFVGMKIYVGNLAYSTNEDSLFQAFGQYGKVDEVAVIMDRETGRPRGFAFVTMNNDEEGRAAIEALSGQELDSRRIVVNEARPKAGGGGGGGGYGGGGGGGRGDRGGYGGGGGGGGGYGGGGGGGRGDRGGGGYGGGGGGGRGDRGGYGGGGGGRGDRGGYGGGGGGGGGRGGYGGEGGGRRSSNW